jgi:hypothetical protein
VSNKFGEWYQKANKTEDTNKLTLLAFKIITILYNTLLAAFIKLLEIVIKGLFRNRLQNCCYTFLDCCHISKRAPFMMLFGWGNRKKSTVLSRSGTCRRQIRGVWWVDFFLCSRLKSIMKGPRFADMAAIQERVTAVLRSITKEAFADSFQKLYEHCQQCVMKDGDYFDSQ